MARYVTRHRAVDAVQVTEEWFDKPWMAPPGTRVDKQRRLVGVGDVVARVGCWIVDDGHERGLRVFSDVDFAERYEAEP